MRVKRLVKKSIEVIVQCIWYYGCDENGLMLRGAFMLSFYTLQVWAVGRLELRVGTCRKLKEKITLQKRG